MNVGIVSDTHGYYKEVVKKMSKIENLDLVLHAGDFVSDAQGMEEKLKCEVLAVAGNCDINVKESLEKIIDIGEKKLLLTHGHLYKVKYGLKGLVYRAKEFSVDAVIFGHTHIAQNLIHEGVLYFNPGSPTYPKGGPGTFGILEIGDDIKAYIRNL